MTRTWISKWQHRAIRGCAALLRDRRGAAALEFAIVGTVMAGALAALIDLGNAAQQRIQLQEAVRAGGSYAAANPANNAGMKAAIIAAVPAAWAAKVTVATPTAACVCWSAGGGTSPCGTGASPCATGQVTQRYITLSASLPYTPLMSGIVSNSASYVVRYE